MEEEGKVMDCCRIFDVSFWVTVAAFIFFITIVILYYTGNLAGLMCS